MGSTMYCNLMINALDCYLKFLYFVFMTLTVSQKQDCSKELAAG